MRKIYSQVVEAKILHLKLQIKEIKLLEDVIPKWSKKLPIDSSHSGGISKAIGVYKIFHAPTDKLMSIGQGAIGARKNRHISISFSVNWVFFIYFYYSELLSCSFTSSNASYDFSKFSSNLSISTSCFSFEWSKL
jgi:hypothetical protein